MILAGFLRERFAKTGSMALTASLVFEQSYGMIDGDSASLAELLTLISSLSGQPLRQDLAVTGSVSQKGQVQAIGGVNHKIEGFFRLCKERGFSGTQGVVIPRSNLMNLMLPKEIVSVCEAGQFSIMMWVPWRRLCCFSAAKNRASRPRRASICRYHIWPGAK